MTLFSLLTGLYVLCAILLTAYALGTFLLLMVYLVYRRQQIAIPDVEDWPRVAVQLPIFNERYVVERLLDAVSSLDYPPDKLSIQVLDDSTDTTVEVVARKVAELRERGVQITHVRRERRDGFKAGALAYGLTLLDVEFVVVLDADFIPSVEFLKSTIPHLVHNPRLALVQGRWGHLNPFDNLLTRGQTLALDGHFVVEQTARNRAGFLMNFNGSAGVWRVKAIQEVGGWQSTTLTEDLDLSYRAQLGGWECLYLPDVVVPGELPPQIAAYKQQQSRWAKGGSQCLRLLFFPVWSNRRLSLIQRLMATVHLAQYMVHPLIVLLVVLTPILLLNNQLQSLNLGILGLAGLAPPLVFVISQYDLYVDWRKRLLAFPILLVLGTGMAYSNAVAAIEGLVSRRVEFRRTPKFAHHWQQNEYALSLDSTAYVEAFLSLYAMWGAWIALHRLPAVVPYLLLYGLAFGMVSLWGILDQLAMRKANRHTPQLQNRV
ncbi:MAG: glycosyltransferase family 2 protein [Anaerolineae bacterium]|nr:glycosyltransferase family 2 protein [Anaerolineae bacterium]